MSDTFTGARAIFRINNEKVAFASSVSYTINHDLQRIDELDRLEAKEYAETGYDVSFSCNTFRVADKSAVSLGIQPKLEDILVQPELVVELVDKVANKTILRLTGVKMTSRSGNVEARGVGTESWTFVGIKASDEAAD